MNRKMNPKKFLLYYVPVAIVLVILGQMFPKWVEDNLVLYYILLLGWAGVSEMLSSKVVKKEEPAKTQQPAKSNKNNKNNKNNNNKYYSKSTKNNKKKHR